MKRAFKIIGLVLLVLFLVLLGAGFYLVHQLRKPYDEARQFLLHEVNYHDVSVACLELMTQPEFRPLINEYPGADDPRLPLAIRDIKAVWLAVNTNEIVIMKTDKFCHLGFVFYPSSTDSNSFELAYCEEGKPGQDILLYTLPRPK